MTERETSSLVDPRLLTPEYWDGHGPEDMCEWIDGKAQNFHKGVGAMDAFARPLMKEFLPSPDKSPIRTFRKGELFKAESFPEGTIILFDREHWSPNEKGPGSPYSMLTYWGVVGSYVEKDVQRYGVVGYWSGYEVVLPWMGIKMDSSMTVGEIKHHRKTWARGSKTESISRITSLQIYSIGKGLKEKMPVPKPRLFPQTAWKPI